MVSLSASGLNAAQDLLDRTASDIYKNGPSPDNSVNLIRAKYQFSADTKVIKTQDEITQRLLDMVG
jgi:flagellar hook protein FlgE